MGLESLAAVAELPIYRQLTKKEVKRFRKFLKKLLCQHGSWAEPWFSEARRLNRKTRYSPIYEIDRLQFMQLVPLQLSPCKLAQVMIFPIRRGLDYQSIARQIFQIESLVSGAEPIYDKEIDVFV
jgi:hypothetical protein